MYTLIFQRLYLRSGTFTKLLKLFQVCSYIINEFRDEFITVALKLILHPAWLCYAALGPTCGEPPDIFPFWNVTIPGNKPKRQPLVRPQNGLPVLKVVQLSDVHVDLAYKPGGVKDCGEPLCCREGLLSYKKFIDLSRLNYSSAFTLTAHKQDKDLSRFINLSYCICYYQFVFIF